MTDEVRLRAVWVADLSVFFDQQLDAESTRMAASPARGRTAFIEQWTRILGDPSVITRTILFNGEVAGNVVSWVEPVERQVGYWIGREYWGKGIATRALSEFLGHVTERPCYAHVAKHNAGSLRVLEKCGFTVLREGRAASEAGGEATDEIILVLRADEGGGRSRSPAPR
jgi:RimJ/RimL family protein N-acetyltransferase